jgi:hypothetical protein
MTDTNEKVQDIRWKQRFENSQSAYQLLQEAIEADKLTPENKIDSNCVD